MSAPYSQIRFVVGIDEAGRGPLAGPVSVGAVVIKIGGEDRAGTGASENDGRFFAHTGHPLFNDVKNSKALTPLAREIWFGHLRQAEKEGTLGYAVSCVSSRIIDSHGIVPAIRTAVRRCLTKLFVPPHETLVLLDGSLYAPEEFLFQETIIRGDENVPIIALASIAAKVVRDRKMVRLSREYPDFDFHIHKGYGTAAHRSKIRQFGPSEIHRISYLGRILVDIDKIRF